jgi:riboflavin biosynthesis pyrimidine reductase
MINFEKIHLPIFKHRPYFYTSFVSTIDGKVFVKKPGYWPIGSKYDYDYFTWLRAHADAIIDGKGTALAFGQKTIATINSQQFNTLRQQLGKTKNIDYVVMTSFPDDSLKKSLKNNYSYEPKYFSEELPKLAKYLKEHDVHTAFIDGGPTLLGSCIRENLLGEIFLTIAPKIYGSQCEQTVTMVEGTLFDPTESIWKLMSAEKVDNEVFLRYKNTRPF